jgi:Helix-hairpin-helix motif
MVKGLANADAAAIIAGRAEQPFGSVDDLWRRAGVAAAALVRLAEADAFRPSLRLARRDALWAIKALRDEPLPLFAAASARESRSVPELLEPAVALRPMTAGGEVVQDYGHVGLTLRSHPVSFLREDLRARRIVTCAEAMAARDGRWLEAAGVVLVRQMPGSAKGVMFITIEDETGTPGRFRWCARCGPPGERGGRVAYRSGVCSVPVRAGGGSGVSASVFVTSSPMASRRGFCDSVESESSPAVPPEAPASAIAVSESRSIIGGGIDRPTLGTSPIRVRASGTRPPKVTAKASITSPAAAGKTRKVRSIFALLQRLRIAIHRTKDSLNRWKSRR